MGAVLRNVTPETAEALLIGAGVKPGERITVIIERRVDAVPNRPTTSSSMDRMAKLHAAKGAGAQVHGPLSAEEIDADIREARGDE